MSGEDFRLTDNITLYHPIVEDIIKLNGGMKCELLYWNYIQTVMCNPYTNMVMLDDMGINFLDITPFEVFMLQWEKSEKDYIANKSQYNQMNVIPINYINQALNFFMKEKHTFVHGKYPNGDDCLYDINNTTCQINKNTFEYIYEWLKAIHKIDYSNQIKPADENARKILIEDIRDEIKRQKRRKEKPSDNIDYIGNLMSAIAFGGNGAITPFNIKKSKMFWLFDGYKVGTKKDHSTHILDGFYHGTIAKKDLKDVDLNWYE